MQAPRAIFFDLDQTLLDGRAVREALQRTCEVLAPRLRVAADRLLERNAEAFREYHPEVQDAWHLGRVTGEELSTEVWRRTLRACGCDDEGLVRQARATHRQIERETHRLFDDARPALEALRAEHAVGLITNGASDTQRDKLRFTAIEGCFDAIVISGEARVAKPDPAIFELALDRLGVAADSAWHVGDNLRTDVAGARDAGLTPVWLNRHGIAPPQGVRPTRHQIGSLAELRALLTATGER